MSTLVTGVTIVAVDSNRYWSSLFLLDLRDAYFRKITIQAMYVRIMEHWSAFMQPLLSCKRNKHYISWVCVCSLRYPVCTAHAPCCYQGSVRLYNIFAGCLINGTFFGGGGKCYWSWNVWFDFLYNFNVKHFSFEGESSEVWSKMYSNFLTFRGPCIVIYSYNKSQRDAPNKVEK